MADSDVEKLISLNRFSNYVSIIPFILYFPVGLLLGLVRLCIFLQICLLSYVLPNSLPFKRLVLRTMLSVTGLPITTQGDAYTKTKKTVLIANHVSTLDPFIISFIHPSIVTIESSGLPSFHPKPTNRLELPADKDHAAVLTMVKDRIKEGGEPHLFFPEKVKTNGKTGLLKFSELPFELDCPVQPITIQLERYLFDFSVSTHSSSSYEDLLWCFILPVTLFKLKFLPVSERKRDESREEFAARVQSNMAKSLAVSASVHTHSDVTEFLKKKSVTERAPSLRQKVRIEDSPAQDTVTQASPSRAATGTGDVELEQMLKQVRDVLPDTSVQVILADLKKTRDVDTTITNILEGKAAAPVPSQGLSPNSLSQGLSFKASKFEFSASARQLSFAERKQAMLEAARLRYKLKHGLE